MSKRKSRRARSQPPPRVAAVAAQSYLARAAQGGVSDLRARIPELACLEDKCVVVVGLGGLGAPSAIEFARAGVSELRLVDFDFVDPGASVRWPLGLKAAGLQKVEALKSFIEANWPQTSVSATDHRFGAIRFEAAVDVPEQVVVAELLDGSSLLYDATTEMGVQHFLSDVARDRGLDYVCLWTVPGAWSGIVARISPDAHAACWLCFRYSLEDGTLPGLPSDDQGDVQPIGCGDPTFTGTSFDVSSIALMGVRLAISTMCGGVAGGYPGCDWDVGIITHRHERERVDPRIETLALAPHSKCPLHTP